jgi:hypothetical protein
MRAVYFCDDFAPKPKVAPYCLFSKSYIFCNTTEKEENKKDKK